VSENIESEAFHRQVQDGLAELVRRSLIQLGDMEELKESAHRLGDEISKATPPPRQWNGDEPTAPEPRI
jgi:hypothetical protein